MTSDKEQTPPKSDAPKTVLTVEEWAAQMRISRGAAYAAVRHGEVKFIRIGRLIRIPNPATRAEVA